LSEKVSDLTFNEFTKHFISGEEAGEDSLQELQKALELQEDIPPLQRTVMRSQLAAVSREGSAESLRLGSAWFREDLEISGRSTSSVFPPCALPAVSSRRGRSSERG